MSIGQNWLDLLSLNKNAENEMSSGQQMVTAKQPDEGLAKKKGQKRESSPDLSNENQPQRLQQLSSQQVGSTSGNVSLNTQQTAPNVSAPNNLMQTTNPAVPKKEKQRPETWNKIEQQIFFKALRQVGKNFESITQYFNARLKRYKSDEGVGVQRSKEQIRHFYYRTWHKIIKYVPLPTLKEKIGTKAANALNNNADTEISLRDIQIECLIAFNVLMDKSLRWNKKTALKLVDLINQGWTTVREKGKIIRLRMPNSKLTTKTVSTETETNSSQTPRTLSIRLEPKSEYAFCRVHRLAQNPYLNIEIPSNQSVKYLIDFLENKWKNRKNQIVKIVTDSKLRIKKKTL